LLPLVIGNVLQVLSGTLSSVFIGQLLGTRALAATSAVLPILYFLNALVIGIGSGGSVLLGQAWGAQDIAKVRTIAGTLVTFGALIGLAFALAGNMYLDAILHLLGTPADVMGEARPYGRLILFTMPALLVSILVMQLLRGMGDTVTPLRALLLSNLSACVVTPAFIRGWCGLPKLGVASAGVATLFSIVTAFVYISVRMRRSGHPLAPRRALLRVLRINWSILSKVARLGVPMGVQMVASTMAQLGLLSQVNRFGSAATASYGVVYQLTNYAQFPAWSIGIATSILGAQAIGAGRLAQLNTIARTGLWMNIMVTGPLIVIGYVFADRLIALFVPDPQLVALAVPLLHTSLWSSILCGGAAVFSGMMRASGEVAIPVGITILCIVAIQLPCAYFLSSEYGVRGIWLASPITFGIMFMLQALFYKLIWSKRPVTSLV
jgi:putative MATE family efflux protein